MNHPLRRRLEQGAWAVAARATTRLVARLPLGWLRWVADGWARLTLLCAPRRRRLAEENVAASFPEMTPAEVRRVVRRSVRSVSHTMMELFMLPRLSPEGLAQLVETPDLGPVREAHASGCGLILITAHFGNWEFLAARVADEIAPMTVIARDASHAGTASLINQARESHHMRVIGRRDTREMLRVLQGGGLLGMLPDQHAAEGGVRMDFLGRPAWTFTGPAVLAARSGARVFPQFCVREADGRLRIVLYPEIELVHTDDREADVVANTRLISGAIERAIREHPDNWLWLHNRWKEPRPRPAR